MRNIFLCLFCLFVTLSNVTGAKASEYTTKVDINTVETVLEEYLGFCSSYDADEFIRRLNVERKSDGSYVTDVEIYRVFDICLDMPLFKYDMGLCEDFVYDIALAYNQKVDDKYQKAMSEQLKPTGQKVAETASKGAFYVSKLPNNKQFAVFSTKDNQFQCVLKLSNNLNFGDAGGREIRAGFLPFGIGVMQCINRYTIDLPRGTKIWKFTFEQNGNGGFTLMAFPYEEQYAKEWYANVSVGAEALGNMDKEPYAMISPTPYHIWLSREKLKPGDQVLKPERSGGVFARDGIWKSRCAEIDGIGDGGFKKIYEAGHAINSENVRRAVQSNTDGGYKDINNLITLNHGMLGENDLIGTLMYNNGGEHVWHPFEYTNAAFAADAAGKLYDAISAQGEDGACKDLNVYVVQKDVNGAYVVIYARVY